MRRTAAVPGHRTLACALAALVACGGDRRQAPPSDSVVTVAADSAMTTASGATYTAPRGWTVRTHGRVVTLEDPDRVVSVTLVERTEREAGAAVAAAWKQSRPDFSRKVRLLTEAPGRDGWDAAARAEYDKTTDGRIAWASAGRKGDTWYVLLCDGTDDGWVARFPEARIAIESFKARGVEEESLRGRKAHVLDEARLRELESFILEGQRAAHVPGLAVAVVQGGKVVFEKGFGVRELGKPEPVTPHTLFRIGSTTKALTSLMMAVLVDEGAFGWNTRAAAVLPSFAVGDPDLTRRLTMSNLVCACTGIPYDNLGTEFEFARLTAESALSRMKGVAPVAAFGDTYQYSNAMIAAGGFLAAHALDPDRPMGPAYREAMRRKVFDRIGMKSTTFDADAVARLDHASPHDRTTANELVSTSIASSGWTAPLEPGWGAWSSVSDLSKYVSMELARGRTPDRRQVVSEANLMARRVPQGRAGDKLRYGLALFVEDYHGIQVIGHPGGVWGYSADLFFLPDHDVGAVVLWNVDYTTGFNAAIFRRKLFELLFDGRDEAREDLAYRVRAQEADFLERMRAIEPEPGREWLARFLGTYENPLFGRVTVAAEDDHGIIDVGEWRSRLGRKTGQDGIDTLVFTSAPWVGFGTIAARENGGRVTLELDAQTGPIMVFEPVSAR